MAIRLEDEYPAGRINPADGNYPAGSIKNEVTPGVSNDGTPVDELWGNDLEGYKQAVLLEAGITANGTPETVLISQILQSQKKVLKTGRKNALIGNFRVNQRVVSGSVVLAAGVYGHDRFKAGSGGCSYTFATSLGVTTLTITAGTLEQVIEGANLESGDYVLSWSGTAQGQIDSGGFGISGGVSATLVGGANSTVEFNTGTLALPQLEKGSLATEFEHRPIGEEIQLCQRYYEKSYDIGVAPGAVTTVGFRSLLVGTPTTSVSFAVNVEYAVRKRAIPAVIAFDNAGNANRVFRAGANKVATLLYSGESSVSISTSDATSSPEIAAHFTADAEL